MTDILQRLRHRISEGTQMIVPIDPLYADAADEIVRLLDRIGELEAELAATLGTLAARPDEPDTVIIHNVPPNAPV